MMLLCVYNLKHLSLLSMSCDATGGLPAARALAIRRDVTFPPHWRRSTGGFTGLARYKKQIRPLLLPSITSALQFHVY